MNRAVAAAAAAAAVTAAAAAAVAACERACACVHHGRNREGCAMMQLLYSLLLCTRVQACAGVTLTAAAAAAAVSWCSV